MAKKAINQNKPVLGGCLTGTISESFTPLRHIWYVNKHINFEDNLPKFNDAPKEQFGSGDLWNEN